MLAAELGIAVLAKDELTRGLTDVLGPPGTVAESQRLGRAAVQALLRIAGGCPSAVLDSTWLPDSAPQASRLPGAVVELQCLVPRALARQRCLARGDAEDPLFAERLAVERHLWDRPPRPLGVGAVVEVDTSGPYDIASVAAAVLAAGGRPLHAE